MTGHFPGLPSDKNDLILAAMQVPTEMRQAGYLRQRGQNPQIVETVRGAGYRLNNNK